MGQICSGETSEENKPFSLLQPLENETTKEQDYDNLLGVSIYWLKTGLMNEIEASTLDGNSSMYELVGLGGQPGPIRMRGIKSNDSNKASFCKSYIDCLDKKFVGKANFFFSYSWKYKIQDIIDTLDSYCSKNNLDAALTYVWMDCFCLNQNKISELVETSSLSPGKIATSSALTYYENIFSSCNERVKAIGHLLSMVDSWEDRNYLKHVWVVYEMYVAIESGCSVTIIAPPREESKVGTYDSFGNRIGLRLLLREDLPKRKPQPVIAKGHRKTFSDAYQSVFEEKVVVYRRKGHKKFHSEGDQSSFEGMDYSFEDEPSFQPTIGVRRSRLKSEGDKLLLRKRAEFFSAEAHRLAFEEDETRILDVVKKGAGCMASNLRIRDYSLLHEWARDIVTEIKVDVGFYRLPGVSVHWLMNGFLSSINKYGFDKTSHVYDIDNLKGNTGIVRQQNGKDEILCTITKRLDVAFRNCLDATIDVGIATYMLSYTWGYTVGHIIDSVDNFCRTYGLNPKRTYIWLCCLCMSPQENTAYTPKLNISQLYNESIEGATMNSYDNENKSSAKTTSNTIKNIYTGKRKTAKIAPLTLRSDNKSPAATASTIKSNKRKTAMVDFGAPLSIRSDIPVLRCS